MLTRLVGVVLLETQRVSYPPTRPIFPSPAALVTSVDANGRPNIITLGEVFNLSISGPVIVGIAIAPARYSHELISASGEFVVNLPPAELVGKVIACGRCSGRDTDKFARFDLTPIPATHVAPPLIAECPVNIECRVLAVQTIGDHDLFQGEVLAHHVALELLDAEGRLVPERLSAVVFAHWSLFAMGELLRTLR